MGKDLNFPFFYVLYYIYSIYEKYNQKISY